MARETSFPIKKKLKQLRKKKYSSCNSWQLGIALALGTSSAIAFWGNNTAAQVIPDGSTPSFSVPDTIKGAAATRINGGLPQGINLFHSFNQFNVNLGERVYFTNPAGIQNILSRVTGNNISNIQGLLGVDGAANLFLMNPKGIIFGSGSSLDVGGSFVGTTANAIEFGNQGIFTANTPITPVPTLTVNPSAFLFNQIAANANIINQSTVGLQVPQGQNLWLLGGDVNIQGGVLRAPGGRIELGGLAASGTVKIVVDDNNPNKFKLDFPDNVARGDVTLTNNSIVDVVAGDGGDIAITARNIDISGSDTNICAGIGASDFCNSPGSNLGSPTSQAGNIVLDGTGKVTIKQSQIENRLNPGATGNSGDIFDAIINRDKIFGSILIGGDAISITDNAQVSASSFGTGSAGVVFLTTKGNILVENSGIFSSMNVKETGNAGGILFQGGSISLNNSQMRVQSSSTNGDAGIVSLKAEGGAISINNSVIFSSVRSEAVGNARGVLVQGRSVALTDSAVSSSTFGKGNAGEVRFTVNDSLKLVRSNIFSNVESGGVGQGGEINVTADSLFLRNGSQMQTIVRGADGDTAAGVGNAGDIRIRVGEAEITGINDNTGKPSLITSSSVGQGNAGRVIVVADRDVSVTGNRNAISSDILTGGVGDAGGVGIVARTLYIRDGARVSVNNLNPQSGNAGAIIIIARDIRLENKGVISAVTLSGQGGDMLLKAEDLLVLTRGSDISTTAGFAPGGGDGGNIAIDTKYIFAVPVNNSNITAQAYQGSGGSIDIDAFRLYKIGANSDDFLNTNDITVSSRYGRVGELRTNVLDVDPTQGLTNPPTDLVDPSQLIAQRCAARSRTTGKENTFTAPGRRGLPSNPNDTLQNESVITDWVTLEPKVENSTTGKPTSAQPQESTFVATQVPPTKAYIEAQGWEIDEKGEIILTAKASTVTPHNPALIPVDTCNGS